MTIGSYGRQKPWKPDHGNGSTEVARGVLLHASLVQDTELIGQLLSALRTNAARAPRVKALSLLSTAFLRVLPTSSRSYPNRPENGTPSGPGPVRDPRPSCERLGSHIPEQWLAAPRVCRRSTIARCAIDHSRRVPCPQPRPVERTCCGSARSTRKRCRGNIGLDRSHTPTRRASHDRFGPDRRRRTDRVFFH